MNVKEKLKICIGEIAQTIDVDKRCLGNKELTQICRKIGAILTEVVNPHFYHEIAEASVNKQIMEKYAAALVASDEPAREVRRTLKPIAERQPTQTWRSHEQILRQQFSTPPAVAYFLAYLLNLKNGEQILEPSAGTGSLAVWARGANAKTLVNEIDSRRRGLLEILGFEPTAYNGEFINDFLAPEAEVDAVLMNPPFSSSGGRTNHNSSRFGFRHVESALERLRRGGKFGVILGTAAGLESKTGNEFWFKMARKVEVKAIVKIAGREYYKNGTSIDINLIVGDKRGEEQAVDWRRERERIVNVSAESVEDAFGFAQKLNLRLE